MRVANAVVAKSYVKSVWLLVILAIFLLAQVLVALPRVAAAPPEMPDNVYTILAAGSGSTVRTQTARNTPTEHNGTNWYYTPGWSIGFAPAGASINQSTADTLLDEHSAKRMSWHLENDNLADGYRTGTHLSTGEGWTRAIYQAWESPPSYYPAGPQTDVATGSLTGWDLCYEGSYGIDENVSMSSIWEDCNGDYLLLAGGPESGIAVDVSIEDESILSDVGGYQDRDIFANDMLIFDLYARDGITPAEWSNYRVYISECAIDDCDDPGDPISDPDNWNEGTAVDDSSFGIPEEAGGYYIAILVADDETLEALYPRNMILLQVQRTIQTHVMETCEDLSTMSSNPVTSADNFELGNDIDCDGATVAPLDWDGDSFEGTFDGKGYTISNLTISDGEGADRVGLFKEVNDAIIRDVHLRNGSVEGDWCVGAIAGAADDTDFQNVSSTLDVAATGGDAGGLVGCIDDGGIFGSFSTGNVTGTGENNEDIGGLIGYVDDTEINESFATGDVTGHYGVGGLVGYVDDYLGINDSYASGTVTGADAVGGLVGDGYEVYTSSSYFSGLVSGDESVGGLVGYDQDDYMELYDSFWDLKGGQNPDTTQGNLGGASGGRTTEQMKNITTYTEDEDLDSPWNFDDVWQINADQNNGYPCLQWSEMSCSASNGPDTDGDNVSDEVEDAAPNNGDANNDGIRDSEQNNVSSYVNTVTGQYAALAVDEECAVTNVGSQNEDSNTVRDSGYAYPAGMMNFTVDCGDPGYTATVTQYYYELTSSGLSLRKYNPNTNAYFNINGGVVSQETIANKAVAKVVYQITDGGLLDIDNEANGVIIDPAGLAQTALGAPNTGIGGK